MVQPFGFRPRFLTFAHPLWKPLASLSFLLILLLSSFHSLSLASALFCPQRSLCLLTQPSSLASSLHPLNASLTTRDFALHLRR